MPGGKANRIPKWRSLGHGAPPLQISVRENCPNLPPPNPPNWVEAKVGVEAAEFIPISSGRRHMAS